MNRQERLSSVNSKIKAFVFDMPGLIFDSERMVPRAWNALLESCLCQEEKRK